MDKAKCCNKSESDQQLNLTLVLGYHLNSFKTKVVINNAFGGFSIDEEIKNWLITNKSWESSYFGKAYNNGNDYYVSEEIRTNKDFIECVETLQKELNKEFEENKQLSFSAQREFKRKHKVLELKVVEVNVTINVEDYNDGYERVDVNWTTDE